MSDIGSISNLAGANPAPPRPVSGGRSDSPPVPDTVQKAVGQPLTTPQSAVTQAPITDNAQWQQRTNPDGHQAQPGTMPTRQQLTDTVQELNQHLANYETNLQFEIDDQYQQVVVRIVDRETKEVVRQIPSERTLALAKFFKEMEENRQTERLSVTKDSKRLRIDGQLLQAIV